MFENFCSPDWFDRQEFALRAINTFNCVPIPEGNRVILKRFFRYCCNGGRKSYRGLFTNQDEPLAYLRHVRRLRPKIQSDLERLESAGILKEFFTEMFRYCADVRNGHRYV